MKKETKRYMLIEFAGIEERVLNSKEEYDHLIATINKHNNRKNKTYVFGNVSCEKKDGKYYVRVRKYHKLTEKMGISELDNMTSNMSFEELVMTYRDQLFTKVSEGFVPDLHIAYLEDKNAKEKTSEDVDRGIKYLPILFQEDIMYLNKKYIFKCLAYYVRTRNYGFFLDLANEFDAYHDVSEQIEALRVAVNKVRYEGYDETLLYRAAKYLYEDLIVERDKTTRVVRDNDGNVQISRRRQRDFGFFIKDYGMKKSKRVSPLYYNPSYPQITENQVTEEVEDDYDDRLQEEYALTAWDQDNGDVYEDYQVEYDPQLRRYIRK